MTGMAVLLLVRPIVRHRNRFAQSDERGDGWSAGEEHLDTAREHRGPNPVFPLAHPRGRGPPPIPAYSLSHDRIAKPDPHASFIRGCAEGTRIVIKGGRSKRRIPGIRVPLVLNTR